MSERVFFDLRLSLPGYTFIGIFTVFNVKFIIWYVLGLKIEVSEPTAALLGVLAGFLALTSGAPLGFLVSQFWYLISQHPLYRWFYPVKETSELLEGEGVNKEDLYIVAEFILHSCPEKELRTYVQRRWDLINTLGSTIIAVLLSLFTAIVVRYWFYPVYDSQIEIFVFGFSMVLVAVMMIGLPYAVKERNKMQIFIVRSALMKIKAKGSLRDVVPREYFIDMHTN